ncbi:hypothetical protein G6011_09832 [Alternaria panax]|uniref:Uncharacterized protein n=1 Tax=Alternaria panax TaxID=48097 RepID=A0AAD4FFS3_9PLEO|nr:hypothetical protein G6011_09832 [Alternaria panax]
MHSDDWEGGLKRARSRTEPFMERYKDAVLRCGLQLLPRTMGEPTRTGGYSYSVIDLTWASPELECLLLELRQNLELPETDHVPIQTRGHVFTNYGHILYCDWNSADYEGLAQSIVAYIKDIEVLPLDTVSQVRERSRDLVTEFQSFMVKHIPRVSRSIRLHFNIDTPEIRALTERVTAARIQRYAEHKDARAVYKSLNFDRLRKKGFCAKYKELDQKLSRLEADLKKLRDIELKRQLRASYAKVYSWV